MLLYIYTRGFFHKSRRCRTSPDILRVGILEVLILVDPRPLQPLQPDRLVAILEAPGANLNVRDDEGETPLSLAIYYFSLAIDRADLNELRLALGLAQRGRLSTGDPVLNFLARLGDNGVVWHILGYWRATD